MLSFYFFRRMFYAAWRATEIGLTLVGPLCLCIGLTLVSTMTSLTTIVWPYAFEYDDSAVSTI